MPSGYNKVIVIGDACVDLHIKIDDLKQRKSEVDQELDRLNSSSLEKISVKGNKYKSKEEYENDLKRREDERDDEILEKVDPLLEEQKKLDKEIKTYEAFRANKDQIYNIMEYQNLLQAKLSRLNEELEKVQDQNQGNRALIEDYEKVQKRINELNDPDKNGVNRIDEIKMALKSKDLEDEERNSLLMELKDLQDKKTKDDEEYIKLTQIQKPDIQDSSKDINEISKNIKEVKNQIEKCNAIWTCLLYGKDWKEIQSVLMSIDNDSKGRNNVYQIKNVESYLHNTNDDISKDTNKKAIFGIFDSRKSGDNTNIQDTNTQDTNLPVKYESFEERHPLLSKIPFIGKIAKKRYDKKIKENETNSESIDNLITNATEKAFMDSETEFLKFIEQDRESMGEFATLMNIAKKGYQNVALESSKKTKKDRLEDKMNYKNKENQFKENLKVNGIKTVANMISEINENKTKEER